MICPNCGSQNAYVIDSRVVYEAQQRRRRMCVDCKTRFTSVEIPLERMQELEKKEKIFSEICCLCGKEAAPTIVPAEGGTDDFGNLHI